MALFYQHDTIFGDITFIYLWQYITVLNYLSPSVPPSDSRIVKILKSVKVPTPKDLAEECVSPGQMEALGPCLEIAVSQLIHRNHMELVYIYISYVFICTYALHQNIIFINIYVYIHIITCA